jgi:hypothetical protein
MTQSVLNLRLVPNTQFTRNKPIGNLPKPDMPCITLVSRNNKPHCSTHNLHFILQEVVGLGFLVLSLLLGQLLSVLLVRVSYGLNLRGRGVVFHLQRFLGGLVGGGAEQVVEAAERRAVCVMY